MCKINVVEGNETPASFLKFFPETFWFLRSLDKEYILEILGAVRR